MIDIGTFARWCTHQDILRKYFIVQRFRQWKSFRCWRKALSRHKFQSAKQVIQERHFINYPDLRKTYCEIQDVLSGISDMGMIEVGPTRTYTLTEFCQEQEERCKNDQLYEIVYFSKEKKEDDSIFRIQKLDTKLLEFRNLIRETVYDACRFNRNLSFIYDPSLITVLPCRSLLSISRCPLPTFVRV